MACMESYFITENSEDKSQPLLRRSKSCPDWDEHTHGLAEAILEISPQYIPLPEPLRFIRASSGEPRTAGAMIKSRTRSSLRANYNFQVGLQLSMHKNS